MLETMSVLLISLLTFYIINALIEAYRFSAPPRLRVAFANPGERGFTYQDVELISQDGTTLRGWYIPSQNGAAIILVHGYAGNRLGVMFHAELLAGQGYGVLLFDLRGHGDSEGSGTFARNETMIADCRAALDFLHSRPELNPARIAMLGISIGGTMAVQAGAVLTGLKAIITDGLGPAAYADLVPPHSWWANLLLPVNRLFFWAVNRRSAGKPLAANGEVIKRLSRPVLFISTGKGGEQKLNRRFFEAANQPKQLQEFPDTSHANGWNSHRQPYAETLITFLNQQLS